MFDIPPDDTGTQMPNRNASTPATKDTESAQAFWSETLNGARVRNAVQPTSVSDDQKSRFHERQVITEDLTEPNLLEQLYHVETECGISRKTLLECLWAIVLKHHTRSSEVVFGGLAFAHGT